MVGLVKYARLCRADDGFPPLHASTIFDLIFTCCCIGSYVLCGLALPRVSLSVTYASRLGPALRKGGGVPHICRGGHAPKRSSRVISLTHDDYDVRTSSGSFCFNSEWLCGRASEHKVQGHVCV